MAERERGLGRKRRWELNMKLPAGLEVRLAPWSLRRRLLVLFGTIVFFLIVGFLEHLFLESYGF